MAFIGVGGDGSVAWVADVDHVRQTSPPTSNPKGQKGHRQQGIDETPDGDQYFTVCIKLPKVGADKFLQEMRAAPVANGKICFKLLIESNTPDQVRVEWVSRP